MDSVSIEPMFCSECAAATDHIIVRNKGGEIIKDRCRVCKHTHVDGQNTEV